MYENYWGLNRRPFENCMAPEFFFRGESHQAALLKLRYAVENRLGAALLAGGIGYGKTSLIEMLGYDLPGEAGPVVHLVYPQLTAAEMLAYLAVELGADDELLGGGHAGLDRTVREIETRLKALAAQKRRPVLVIDDAQLIDDLRVFQALQLLLNFQQRGGVEFSLILVGERSLLAKVERMEQLDERLAVKSLLRPLTEKETAGYIGHRLSVAGATNAIFDPTAIASIFELSGGVPRKINRLCDMALLVGYADELRALTCDEVEAVGEELVAAVG